MRLRLKNVLADEKVRYDIVDAVLEDVDDIYSVELRAQAVAGFLASEQAEKQVQAFVRAANLAKKAESSSIDAGLLKAAEENALYQVYASVSDEVQQLLEAKDYEGALEALTRLAAPIDAFFDGVMVMDKDEKIKNNRLGLLKSIHIIVNKVADFNKIVF